jgi:glycosyltransferase involved in cell wall biosynthesis
MTLLVRDADDLIRLNLDFHLHAGVDHFIVMDNLSTDGTTEILRQYERQGLVTYLHQPEDTFAQARWVTAMARRAHADGADWVINNDADEFWYPTGGDLKHVLSRVPAGYDAVAIERSHFVPRPLPAGAFFADALTVRFRRLLDPNGNPWPGKVCHRAYSEIEVGPGNHSASIAGRALSATGAAIEILHFPIRSYEKFERTVVNGGAASGRNPDRPAKRWQDLYELWKRGELRAYYDAQTADDEAIEAGLCDGRYVVDERLKQVLTTQLRR